MKDAKISNHSIIRKIISAAAFVACGSPASAQDAPGELEAPVLLRSTDDKVIDMKYFSVPTVADIDGDGKTDLVVGQFMNHNAPWLRKPGGSGCAGTATWYRNVSKGDDLPSYAPGADLESDGGLLYAANW